MAAASVPATAMASKLRYSKSDYQRAKPAKKVTTSTKLAIHIQNQNSLRFSSQNATKGSDSVVVRALGPQRDDGQEDSSGPTTNTTTTTNNNNYNHNYNNTAFTSQEDLDYLWKLIAGSIAGAAIIKYGSVVFPEITRPNITQALLMILTPVVVAVLLLINQSRKGEPS